MQAFFTIPNWLFVFDAFFELAFAVIALLVSLYSFKIYRLSEQRQPKLFAYSFLFISLAYFIQSFLNFSIVSKLNEQICGMIKIIAISTLNSIGTYVHIFFFIIGLVTLAYMTMNIESKKTYSLLLIISMFFVLLSSNKIYSFYLLSSILLIYITLHYYFNYIKNKQAKTLLVLIAFIFLLFGSIHFLISVNHLLFYTIAHFLALAAYLLILANLILVSKNGKKKKQA